MGASLRASASTLIVHHVYKGLCAHHSDVFVQCCATAVVCQRSQTGLLLQLCVDLRHFAPKLLGGTSAWLFTVFWIQTELLGMEALQ